MTDEARDKRNMGIEALLLAARADYGARLVAKVAEIAALASACDWAETRRAAHKVRGSAATYGFADVGAAAGQVEDLLLAVEGPPDANGRAEIERWLRAADRMARAVTAAAPEDP